MIVARKEAGTKVKCALRSLLPVKSTKAGARCVLVYRLFVLPRPLKMMLWSFAIVTILSGVHDPMNDSALPRIPYIFGILPPLTKK